MSKKLDLKRIRENQKLTQTELAKKMGLCRSSIAKKESGKVALTIEDLKFLRSEFNIDLNDLEI